MQFPLYLLVFGEPVTFIHLNVAYFLEKKKINLIHIFYKNSLNSSFEYRV